MPGTVWQEIFYEVILKNGEVRFQYFTTFLYLSDMHSVTDSNSHSNVIPSVGLFHPKSSLSVNFQSITFQLQVHRMTVLLASSIQTMQGPY